MRYEKKFVASLDKADFALVWLNHVCLPDPVFPEGCISSIYYDTPGLSSYREKENGDYLKTKVRLRWYNPSLKNEQGQIPGFLEIKMKDGWGGHKIRKEFFFTPGWLDSADLGEGTLIDFIYKNVYAMGISLAEGLFPMVNIIYERRRFICPFSGARVSLDQNIRLGQINNNFLPDMGSVSLESAVLEVKEEGVTELPWMDYLQSAGFRFQSFSKYGFCMSKLIHGVEAV